jgi:hypothetical protein
MDKKLYDELVNRNIITDTFMTLEKINERGIKLENIITQPEMYKIFSKYVSNEEVVEPITQPDKNEETQPTQPAPVVEPEKEAEVEPVKEEEGIVVDDNVVPEPIPEPTPEAPKTKSKKSKEVVSE